MKSLPFTARNVAKYVVKAIIHKKTADTVTDVITNHTSFEEDDLVVEIGSHAAGWYVSDKLKPYSDRMVDRVADKVTELRNKRKDSEETPETEK